MKRYQIVTSTNRQDLEERVSLLIDDGWDLVGRSYLESGHFYQTMVKSKIWIR